MKPNNYFSSFISFILVFVMIFAVMSPVASAVSFDESMLGNNTYLTSKTDYAIASGITESYITTNNADGKNQVQCFALEVDLNDKSTSIIASYKNYDASEWGMQKVRDQAYAAEEKLGVNVVAGVNGDFYNMSTGAPTGTFVMNGVKYTENTGWNYFAILKDGTPVIGSGYIDTSTVQECVGGPAVILKDGELTEAAKASGYGVDQLPRTAVGITADGKVVFLVSDGRQEPRTCGHTFLQLAEAMLAMGCVDALSLDGGGSATFVTDRDDGNGLVCRSMSSDGSERTVSSALLICSTATSDDITDEPSVVAHEHDYVYQNNILTCSECGETVDLGTDYTGFASDAESGSLMYFINGKAVTGWFSFDTDNYYFDKNGMAKSGNVVIDGKTYVFGDDGKLTKGALVKEGYYTYYYLDGVKQRGWHMIEGYWYYFDRQTGFGMATGDNCDKVSIDLDRTDGMYTISSTDEVLLYTFDSKGRLTKGSWLTDDFGVCYMWGPLPAGGLQEIDGELYYFDAASNYYMITDDSVIVDDVLYTFDENGVCDYTANLSILNDFINRVVAFLNKVSSCFVKIFK